MDHVAIAAALEQLGITPTYHMREVGINNHQSLWIDAMRSETAISREYFDRMFAGYKVQLSPVYL
jgi:hypothetical protein